MIDKALRNVIRRSKFFFSRTFLRSRANEHANYKYTCNTMYKENNKKRDREKERERKRERERKEREREREREMSCAFLKK